MARKYHRIISTLAVGGLLAAFAPGAYAASATELGTKYETLDESLWSCVWNDEFDGSSVDTTKQSYTVGGGGFGNNEQQYYTDSASNSYIQDGCLVIEALQESNGDENYTSAKLTSTESWTYGRLEFRAKLPSGTGLWPAIWMLPDDTTLDWPISGEIDIMEYMGSDTDTVLGTLHYGNPWVYNTGYYNLADGASFADDFHTFAVEWLPGEMRWYVDGELYQIQQDWYSTDSSGTTYAYPAPFNDDFHLILNLAVGGYFPGDPDTSTWTSTKFQIDYVRVYEYTGSLTESSGSTQTPYTDLLTNSTFDSTLDGWNTWTENGSTFTVEDGAFKANVYTILPNTWSTQLYQNVPVYKDATYQLSFRAKSSVARNLTVGLEGANNSSLFSETFSVGTDWQTYTYTFSPSVSNNSAKLLFFMGNVSGTTDTAHDIYLDDITLEALPDELVTNGDFSDGLTGWETWTENGSTYNCTDGAFVATIPTTLPNTWSAQLYQNITLPENGTYKISFKAKSSIARQITVALEKDALSPAFSQTFDVGTDWTTIEYTFSGTTSYSSAKLVFMLGNVGSTSNTAHTVQIDDVHVYQLS